MRTLNLGILAHVDAGKTSLTERLLYAAGVIDEIGSVDRGSTQTDTLSLERQRGITIKAAVVSFVVDDITINLIDTPGHPDFITEVERVLNVLDGAVLVVSAVEGVQAQTRILMRALRRLQIPTLIFVNKIDRMGARDDELLQSLTERLSAAVVPMGSVAELGTRDATFTPFADLATDGISRWVEPLAAHDDDLLAQFVSDEAALTYGSLRDRLAEQTRRSVVQPVFFGSAITGSGVDSLTTGITGLLPTVAGDVEAALSGTVFKISRGAAGEKVAYVRLFAGTVTTRDRLVVGDRPPEKITRIGVFECGAVASRTSASAGEIAQLWGLGGVRIGDAIGAPRPEQQRNFAPPSLETVVVPRRNRDAGTLHAALAELAEQDPLIDFRVDDEAQISISLYGEVQKEVIQATLADEYGVEVSFQETTTLCIERVDGRGAAVELINGNGNPFLATVGVQIEPGPEGSGLAFALAGDVLGTMPLAFVAAVEATVPETLRQGLLGWPVPDCVVTVTHTGYAPRQSHSHAVFDKSMSSTAGDFRLLTPLVMMAALRQAGTTVCEPIDHFELEIPADALSAVMPVLVRYGGIPAGPRRLSGSLCLLEGEIPAAQVLTLTRQLPTLTRGEGVLQAAFARFRPAAGAIPRRIRTGLNPLDRKEYLLAAGRRTPVAG